jgi:hypothetical protein
MDFQYTRSGGQGLTYDVEISLRSEGPELFSYSASVKRAGGYRGKSISGKVLRATDANKAAAEARQQVMQQIEAFGIGDE